MKFWVTKYALTQGIQEVEAKDPADGNTPSMLVVKTDGCFGTQGYHGEGKEWHRSPESAQKRANEMVKAKIASLKKSLAKFEKMLS
jgi:hypothetical protein